MSIQKIECFKTSRGTLCATAEDADRVESAELAAEAHAQAVRLIMAPLGPLHAIPGNSNYENGDGYVAHEMEAVRRVARALLSYAQERHPRLVKTFAEKDHGNPVVVAHLGRYLDGCDHEIERAASRLYCIDRLGREWGQPYYALGGFGTGKVREIQRGEKKP